VIFWKDFILDDGLGPVLSPGIFSGDKKVRRSLNASRSRIKDDASARALIQETRRDAEPLSATNTGCGPDTAWTKVQVQGMEANLEDNASSHMDVESDLAKLRPRGAG